MWAGGETAGLRKALRAETRTTGQAVRSAALAHPCLPAAAATPPQPLSIARDQPHFCFVLGGSRPRGGAAASSPAFTLHATSVQTLQEFQGWSPVRRTRSNVVKTLNYLILTVCWCDSVSGVFFSRVSVVKINVCLSTQTFSAGKICPLGGLGV